MADDTVTPPAPAAAAAAQGQTPADTTKNQAKNALDMMATAATTLREAINASLPVSSTQLMTVQIPGTIIDPRQVISLQYIWHPDTQPFQPLAVRIAEAKLVDNQVPISKVMMGRTGKSVSRSYLATLDCLVSVETSIAAAIASDKPLTDRQIKVRDRYDQAMKYLTEPDAYTPGKSRLQTYVEKQSTWNKAVEAYNEAQFKQQKADQDKGLNTEQQRQSFLEWMQMNGRDFKATIQAKYMDWVVHGYKFTIEFNFGVVDVTSAMKRIESSKEAYRNLTLLASDGASEYCGVNLTPPNWATLVQNTVDAWMGKNSGPSAMDLRAEIKRLQNILISHQGLLAAVEANTFVPHVFGDSEDDPNDTLRTKYQQAYADIDANDRKEPLPADEASQKKRKNPFGSMAADTETWNKALIAKNRKIVRASAQAGKDETKTYISNRIKTIEKEIKSLEDQLKNIGTEVPKSGAIVMPPVYDEQGKTIDDKEIVADKELFKHSTTKEKPSPWTRITAKVAASQSDSVKTASESSTGGGVGLNVGLWSVSGGGSHSSSKSSSASSMANLDVELSMDCMLVEIDRPWLHAELFSDHELDAAPGFKISPGPAALQKAAESHEQIETDYTQFSSYPNAFVIACNVELEFNGDTSALESQLEASSTEVNASVGWGPFTISSAHKSSKSSAKTKAQSTATGMHISLQAPQIIAWVQELLPALPKPLGDNPALFGLPLAKVETK